MKAINQGNTFTIYSNALKTYDQLPAQAYISYNHSRIPTHISLREITETDIGKTIFYTKEDAVREAQRRARR